MKDKLIPRAYRIRKDQDVAIKRKAKESKGVLSESGLVRLAIDKEIGLYIRPEIKHIKGKYTEWNKIHTWLNSRYGKAKKCENLKCETPDSNVYHYALLRTKKYEKNRENFAQLCPQCHARYDRWADWDVKLKRNLTK